MRAFPKPLRWLTLGLALAGVSGCVSNQQLFDFARTEVARISADIVSQVFTLFIQSVAPQ